MAEVVSVEQRLDLLRAIAGEIASFEYGRINDVTAVDRIVALIQSKGQNAAAIFIEVGRIEALPTGSKEEQAGAVAALEWVQGGCEGEVPV